jgi:hypothetical protein
MPYDDSSHEIHLFLFRYDFVSLCQDLGLKTDNRIQYICVMYHLTSYTSYISVLFLFL